MYFMYSIAQQQALSATSLSDKDKNICGAAITIFQSVLHSLYDGSITVDMLKKLHSKQVRVNNIVVAIDKTSLKEKSVTDTKAIVSGRFLEFDRFTEYQVHIQYLCYHCQGLDIQGTYASSLSCIYYDAFHVSFCRNARINRRTETTI